MASRFSVAMVRCSVAVLVAMAIVASGTPAPAQSTTGANQALAAGKLAEARQAYLAEFERSPSFAAAANLGGVELELGLAHEAAEHLALSLQLFPEDGDPAARGRLGQLLAKAERLAAEDGSTGPSHPAADASASAVDQNLDEAQSGPSLALLVTGTALGIAGIAVGTALFVTAAQHDSYAADEGAALEGLGLADPCGTVPASCEEIQVKQGARDDYTLGAIVAYSIGGLALAGTIAYGVLASASAAEPDTPNAATELELSVLPALGTTGPDHRAGAVLRGRW